MPEKTNEKTTKLTDHDRRFLARHGLRMPTVDDEVRLLKEGK